MESCAPMCGPVTGHWNIGVLLVAAAIIVFLVIPVLIVQFIAWWRICTKAGLSGWLCLVMVVPGANIILPLIVAFVDWPVLSELRALKDAPPAPPQA
jgi:hypothetical protein